MIQLRLPRKAAATGSHYLRKTLREGATAGLATAVPPLPAAPAG